MTHSQALQTVEDMLTDLGLKDRYGDEVIGLEAIGLVAKYCGAALESLENEFFGGSISPEQYVEQMGGVLEEFKKQHFVVKLEKQLTKIMGESA